MVRRPEVKVVSAAIGDWGFRIADRFRWYTERKFSNLTQLDIERVLIKEKSFFRATTKGRWFQLNEGYYLEQKFMLFRKIKDGLGVAPEWRTLAQTEVDDFIQETRIRLRIRKQFSLEMAFF